MKEIGKDKSELKPLNTNIQKKLKGDTQGVIKFADGLFSTIYTTSEGNVAITNSPPYNPVTLKRLIQANNKLLQCIQAMEVNIDGTGHSFVAIDSDTEVSEEDFQRLTDFFNEPYPNEGFIEQRRKLRNDLESTGNAYLSVIENLNGEVVATQVLPSAKVRVGKSSKTIMRDFTVKRNGVDLKLSLPVREDVYSYTEEKTVSYYLSYGSSQFINKTTGQVSPTELPINLKGGKIIHFRVVDDPTSNYGVPRWINQLPSVIGSRKAEEQNLELLDNGGIPSAIIFLKGGAAVDDAHKTLTGFLSGGYETNRAVAVTVQSTEGTIDSAGKVDVQVERFGSESVQDSMYQNYQQDCKNNLRLAFRLPPLFTGETQDFSYATAYISYMVAEAQVFKPERDAFDEIINNTIVKALGVTTAKFQSNPISLSDASEQLKALMSIREVVEPQDIVDTVNQLADLNVRYKEDAEFTVTSNRSLTNGLGSVGESLPTGVLKSDSNPLDRLQSAVDNLFSFALDYGKYLGLLHGKPTLDGVELSKKFDKLSEQEKSTVNKIISVGAFQTTSLDCCNE